MSPERFKEVTNWIKKRNRPWTLMIEDDKVRIISNAFIMDMRIIRDIELELRLTIDDVMSHVTFGIVLLCRDTVKNEGV